MTVPQKTTNGDPGIIEAVIAKGDLSKLTPDERVRFYNETCRSLGLNPLTRPFEYIHLNGKLQLYARRDATDQLRKLRGISVQIVSQEIKDDLLTIHARAKDKDGREDEDLGVVNFPAALKGELRANTIMKAVTKAKRRVTLSIAGLGFLDETEIEDIPRDNPHVNQPDEIVDVPPPDHPDRVPPGNNELKPLRVKDQRIAYEQMIAQMHAIKTIEEFEKWKIHMPERMQALGTKWKEYMQTAVVGYAAELRSKEESKEPTISENWLEDLYGAYADCMDLEELFQVDLKFSPRYEQAPKDEQTEAGRIRDEHWERLEANK
jgi:hypothetical protein